MDPNPAESRRLLSESPPLPSDADTEPDLKVGKLRAPPAHDTSLSPASTFPSSTSPRPPAALIPVSQRQSSIAQPRPDGTPRTPNRVRFQEEAVLIESRRSSAEEGRGPARPRDWEELEEDDFLENGDARGHGAQRLPLLTGIEAPSVTIATTEFDPEEHLESARPRSGLRSAFLNMANSIIGAGIIGQPYAFRNAGLLTGILLLVGLTITVDWTIRLIVINSKLSGADSFQATVEHCFGKSGLVAISLAQWLFAFGGMVAFCVVVGDTIPRVLDAFFPKLADMSFLWLLTNRRAVIVLFILGISYPLSLYRDIAKLAKASGLALISMSIIIVTVVTQSFRVPAESRGALKGGLIVHSGIFEAIGVISFAFVCHHNSLLIYGSLRKPTIDRFAQVTHISTGVSMLACLVMALAGYLTFGDKTAGNVLNNFPTDNIMVNIARLCFGLNMLTTLPLEAFVCREVLNTYYFPAEPFNPNRHLLFTTALVVSAMGLALVTCDLGIVFELFGATSASALAYILPPLCYIKLMSRGGPASGSGKWEWRDRSRWRIWVAGAVVAFGTGVMAVTVVKSLAKVGGSHDAAQC